MIIRLAIFVATLIFLPMTGLWLSGLNWNDLNHQSSNYPLDITLICIIALLIYIFMTHQWLSKRTNNSLFQNQRNYLWAMAASSVALCGLVEYLNLFLNNWSTNSFDSPLSFLLSCVLWSLIAPAIIITRALLGSFATLLTTLGRGFRLPNLPQEALTCLLPPLAAYGLLGAAAWPEQLFLLTWFAPILVLCCLQVLWHESTVFSGIKYGDWGRVCCAIASGLLVGNLLATLHHLAGGLASYHIAPHYVQLGYALLGLVCLQLGDIVAEAWRGKQGTVPRYKKPFPIPVVAQSGQLSPGRKCAHK